jgi:hypothetical protein
MPRAPTEIRSLARSHTRIAIKILVGIVQKRECATSTLGGPQGEVSKQEERLRPMGAEVYDQLFVALIHQDELPARFRKQRFVGMTDNSEAGLV